MAATQASGWVRNVLGKNSERLTLQRISRIPRGVLRRLRRFAGAGRRKILSLKPAPRPRKLDDPADFGVRVDLARLAVANRLSVRKVTSKTAGHPVVTVTTHGDRLGRAHIALEAIARGTQRPSRLILWLDDEKLYQALPRTIKRLQRRGLEVILDPHSYRVHTKYFPYVTSIEHHTTPMVTADDDIVYPPYWLAKLQQAHAQFPDDVVCFRAHRIVVDGDTIAPYATWPAAEGGHANAANLGTSVSGQLFPPRLLDALRDRGDEFRTISPDADDLWLHACGLREHVLTRQIDPNPIMFPFVPGSQATGLYLYNYWDGGNDAAIARLYSPEDIAIMSTAAEPDSARTQETSDSA